MLTKLKPLISSIAILLVAATTTQGQNFTKDYQAYLLNRGIPIDKPLEKRIKASIHRVELTLQRFESEQGHSFIQGDTVYLISFYGVESGFSSGLVWNGSESCHFQYTFKVKNQKVKRERLIIVTDASKYINELKPEFKHFVRTADTAGYRQYGHENSVLDGSAISFTRAIRHNSRWTFILSGSYITDVYNRD